MKKDNKLAYTLLDSGHGRKLEAFGSYILNRPCSQAVWSPKLPNAQWQAAQGMFTREGDKKWTKGSLLPEQWFVELAGLKMKLSATDFGHVGVFPEHSGACTWVTEKITQAKRPLKVLNLFAYSGIVTLAAAKAGAEVCHLDASKGMVAWARENAQHNKLDSSPIRWIIDDVFKFLKREIRRGRRYDGIVLDPPSFGRGASGEIFKIEAMLLELLDLCRQVLSEQPAFVHFSCHTPGYTPLCLEYLLEEMRLPKGSVESGEMLLPGEKSVRSVPCGTYARWSND